MTNRTATFLRTTRQTITFPLHVYGALGRFLQRRLPKGLFPRSLLIIVVPIVVLQGVVAYVFMERHWELVTNRLSQSVVGEIAALIELMEQIPLEQRDASLRTAGQMMGLTVSILPEDTLPPPAPKPFFTLLDRALSRGITDQIGRPFWIDTVGRSSFIEIRIKLDEVVLRIITRRNQAYASNSHIFIVWMVVSSLVILSVAVLFLRNQIRPIQRLADAAQNFGKGRPTPDFRLRGAREVRVASAAFMDMRRRIERQIEQRTTMLAGVSHDLRTILTRFRLEVELLDPSPERDSLRTDLDEMESMLSAYLEFAQGAADEAIDTIDLKDFLAELAQQQRVDPPVAVSCDDGLIVPLRRNAFKRCVGNLVSNALRYGDEAAISARRLGEMVIIAVDDDGPGISEKDRSVVFRPFYRLDAARNADDGGTGLGLSIALDIARSHGGDIRLSDSEMGGLRAEVRIPI